MTVIHVFVATHSFAGSAGSGIATSGAGAAFYYGG